jgi:hypothetical protein
MPTKITLSCFFPEVQTALITGARMSTVQEHTVRQVGVTDDTFQKFGTKGEQGGG